MITLDNIKIDADIIDIIHLLKEQLLEEGIHLLSSERDTPDNFMISCPYHKNGQERRPSAGIKKTDGMFHCFACDEVHTLPEVVSHCFGKNDAGLYGHQWLLENFVLITEQEERNVTLNLSNNKGVVTNPTNSSTTGHSADSDNHFGEDDSDHAYVSEEELDRYRYTHPYMYKRGLTDEIIELFDIGYDKETECLTFPVKDIKGNVLFIARRSVNTKFFNYPAGAEKPLYGLYELFKSLLIPRKCMKPWISEVIVTESMLDALSFWTIGKPALALNGLGNDLQIQQLKELPCRCIILATDMDEAGQKARRRLKRQLKDSKLIYEYDFPAGRKDANDCTKEELRNLQKRFV